MMKNNSFFKLKRSSLLLLALTIIFAFTSAANPNVNFNSTVVDPNADGRTAIGDIDGDGFDDIVVHTWGSNRGLVYDGVLTWYKYPAWTKYTISTGKNYFGDDVVLADIDNDGDFDIVTCRGNDNSAQVYYYLNPGGNATSGWIERYVGTVSTASEVKDIKVDDFDYDGKLDIAVRSKERLGFYFQNNPTSWSQRLINIREREGMAIGDIDWDGRTDVVLNGFWLKNPANARTGTWTEYAIDSKWYSDNTNAWQDFSVMVEVGDINKDGKPDVVYSHSEKAGYYVTWYSSNNPRGGQTAWLKKEIAIVDYCHTLQLGDIDRDDDLDIIVGNSLRSPSPRVMALYNNNNGSSWTTSTLDYKSMYKGKVGDIDNDGDLDILSAISWEDAPLNLWKNTLDPGLGLNSWQRFLIDGALAYNAMSVLSEDLDGDGLSDIIAGGWWWKNPGSANGAWVKKTIGSPLNSASIIYDFDQDGDMDIFGTQGLGAVANNKLAWARNNGNGDFTIFTNISTGGTGDFLQGSVISDFGSGNQIALSWHNGGGGLQSVRVPSNPSSTTWSFSTLSSATQMEDLNTGDIDGDGNTDILLGTIWLKNNGGSWTAYNIGTISDIAPGAVPDRNALVDINGDNRLDAVIGLENGTYLVWFEAPVNPTAPWKRHIIGTVEGQGFSMNAEDFDNDGDPDIVLGEHRGPSVNRVIVFENRNGGLYWRQHIVDSDSKNIIDHHIGTLPVDLDNDGDKDIVSIGWYNKKLWVYENKAIDELFPVVYKQPVDQTVLAGESATFSVSVSGAQPLIYQWRKNGINISGANSSTYTTPATTDADNGSLYSCYIYNSQGDAISENALLTVLSNSGVNIVKNGDFESGNRDWWAINNSFGGAGYNFYTNSSDPISGSFDMVMAVTSSGTTDSRPMLYGNLSENLVVGQSYIVQFKTRVNWGSPRIAYINYGEGLQGFNNGNALSGNQSWMFTVNSAVSANDFIAFYMDGRSIGAFQIDDISIYRVASTSPPSISTQPQSKTVLIGGTVSFSVTASGTAPLKYQWYKNDVIIFGAASSSYTTPAAAASDNGAKFSVIVSNDYGSVVSNYAILTVNASLPAITIQPENQAVFVGQTATFAITATGTTPLSYQWKRNGVNINGATNSSYTTPEVSSTDNGVKFSCTVSNSAGSVTSNQATLTVLQNSGVNIVRNSDFESGDLSFWSSSNSYGGAVYSFLASNSNPINGNYSAVVRVLTAGSSNNRPLLLADLSEPMSVGSSYKITIKTRVIVGNPQIAYINFGNGVQTFSPGSSLNGTQTWTFNLDSATEANRYLALYVNGLSGGTFAIDDVSIVRNTSTGTPPVITSQPTSQTILAGNSVTFSVTASGSSPLNYQWKRNGTNISGATGSSYTISSVSLSDNGSKFSCVVTNSEGTVASLEATLTVIENIPQNIVLNGDLEDGTKDNWAVSNTFGGANYNFLVNNSGQISGNYDLRMSVISAGTANSRPLLYANLSQKMIIGQPYIINFKTKVISGSPKIAYINYGNGTQSFNNGNQLSGTQTWNFTVNSASEANNFLAFYVDGRSVGTFQIDDVSIVNNSSSGTPPIITSQPIGQTVTVGEAVTFNITASGTTPINYQWRKNGSNISGATNTSYSIPSASLSDNGAQFSCIVSNSLGSVISNSVVLTVLEPTYINLVQNGDFEFGNTSFWSISNTYGNASYSFRVNSSNPIGDQFDGLMRITSAGTSNNRPLLLVKLSEALVVGQPYLISFTTKVVSGNPKISYINYGSGLFSFNNGVALSGTQNWTISLPQAVEANQYIAFYLDGTSLNAFEIDNLTLTTASNRPLSNPFAASLNSAEGSFSIYIDKNDEMNIPVAELRRLLNLPQPADSGYKERAAVDNDIDFELCNSFNAKIPIDSEPIVYVDQVSLNSFNVYNLEMKDLSELDFEEFQFPQSIDIYGGSVDSLDLTDTFIKARVDVSKIKLFATSENDSLFTVKTSDNNRIILESAEISEEVTSRVDLYISIDGNSIFKSKLNLNFLPKSLYNQESIPTSYDLFQNYPNPFNPETTIKYALPYDSQVKIDIYNTLGELVSSLFNGSKPAGVHQINWNAGNYNSGVYFYRISAVNPETGKEFMSVKKMALIK